MVTQNCAIKNIHPGLWVEHKKKTVEACRSFVSAMDEFGLVEYEEVQFDQQTQARLDAAVDKLLKGYDWTLAPLAQK